MNTIRVETDSDGIAWVVFNNWVEKHNFLNPPELRQLDVIVTGLTRRPPRGVVFISGKKDMFLAGLDAPELHKLKGVAAAEEISLIGQRLFGQITALPVPTVAAIDGRCTCGGHELALACRHRVATNSPHTVLSFTEVLLGAIPAWGATYRLPRLIGVRRAMDLIVNATALPASAARQMGLVDAVVSVPELRAMAKRIATGEKQLVQRAAPAWKTAWPMRALACQMMRFIAREKAEEYLSGQLRAIVAVEQVLAIRHAEERQRLTARLFAESVTSCECKNLLRAFFFHNLDPYRKLLGLGPPGRSRAPAKKLPEVGMIAAGAAGARIAQWCSRCGIIVRLQTSKPAAPSDLMRQIEALYTEQRNRRKIFGAEVQDGMDRLQWTDDFKGFDGCKLIIEAANTPIGAWPPIARELDRALRRGSVLAVHALAAPIEPWALATSRPKQVVGIQFFDPVDKRELVELVCGADTSPESLAVAATFVAQLKKLPVVAKSRPGFLVNRLLMLYLNEAARMLGEGIGGEAIDQAMLDFGWWIGPLRLIDEIGMDECLEVLNELAAAYPDRIGIAPVLQEMRQQRLQGRTSCAGFYVHRGCGARLNKALKRTRGKSLSAEAIQKRLMVAMIAEAKRCLDEKIVTTEDDIDLATIFGAGFPKSLGGLVTYARNAELWS
jgi:3-hydroxyacyl-CoA dehydrogenase / enoyl-CoA hydratase / 3-hydroxybutyryl-CoA epimerase